MYTIGLLLRLRPGAYAAYKEAHDALWPELARGMELNRVSMAIYRIDDERLFVFAAAPTQEDWTRSRDDPVLKRWNESMSRFLEVDARGEIALERCSKTFGFGEFE
jgi:L-rhamnose mutarotase